MANETVSRAITNGNSANPIQASVVSYSLNPNIKGLVALNPDGTSIGGGGGGGSITIDSTSITGSTPGSILFVNNSSQISQANDYLYINPISKVVGFGTNTPMEGAVADWMRNTTAGQGTISVTAAGTTVTGTGTTFLSTFQQGQTITANGETRTISQIASDTSMTTDAWTNTFSGSYTLTAANLMQVNQSGLLAVGDPANISIANLRTSGLAVARTVNIAGVTSTRTEFTISSVFSKTNATGATAIISNNNTPTIGASNNQALSSLTGYSSQWVITSGATGVVGLHIGYRSAGVVTNTMSITDYHGFQQASSPTGTITNSAAFSAAAMTGATNNTYMLLGTTTIPSGNWAIYSTTTNSSSFAGDISITLNGIGSTPTDGLDLINTTAAANGAQQFSPAIMWRGSGWKSSATAASWFTDARMYMAPVQGSTAATGVMRIDFAVNGGAYTNRLTLNDAGTMTIGGSFTSGSSITSGGSVTGTDWNGAGIIKSTTTSTNANLNVAHASSGVSTTDSKYLFAGAATVFFGVAVSGSNGPTLTANSSYARTVFASSPVTTAATGTTALLAGVVINPIGTITSGGATVTRTASLYIQGPATATVTDDNHSLYINSGPSYFGGGLKFDRTITPAGTTGNQIINKPAGTVNFAAGAATLTVTNSLVTANSLIFVTVRTVDALMTSAVVVAGAGSFVITADTAPAAETSVGFIVFN